MKMHSHCSFSGAGDGITSPLKILFQVHVNGYSNSAHFVAADYLFDLLLEKMEHTNKSFFTERTIFD
jgi:hypothetical protein